MDYTNFIKELEHIITIIKHKKTLRNVNNQELDDCLKTCQELLLDLSFNYEKSVDEIIIESIYNANAMSDCEHLLNGFSNNVNAFYLEERDYDYYQQYISNNEILELTHDFYKSLNKTWFNLFIHNFKRRKEQLSFVKPLENEDGVLGICFDFHPINKKYLLVCNNNNIETLLTTIHEYGHACDIDYRNGMDDYQECLFRETTPIFMELIATDYFNKIIEKKDLVKCSSQRIDCYNQFALKAIDFFDLKNLVFSKKIKNMDILEKYIKNNNDLMSYICSEDFSDYDLSSDMHYIMSFMQAIELYGKYLIDPEQALYLLSKATISDVNVINLNKSVKTYTNREAAKMKKILSYS